MCAIRISTRFLHSTFLTRILFVFVVLLKVGLVNAQEVQIDSLKGLLKTSREDTGRVRLLYVLSQYFTALNSEEGDRQYTKTYEEGLALSNKLSFDDGLAQFNFYNGVRLLNKAKFEEAISHLNIAIEKYKKLNNYKTVSQTYVYVGECYMRLNKYAPSKSALDTALIWADKTKDELVNATVLRQLGELYETAENFPQALNYYFKVLDIFSKHKSTYNIFYTHVGIGYVYARQQRYKEALAQYETARNFASRTDGSIDSTFVRGFIADCFLNLGEYEKAIAEHTASLKVLKRIRNNEGVVWSLSNIARAEQALGKKAIQTGNLQQGRQLFESAYTNFKESLQRAYDENHLFGMSEQNAFIGNICIDLRRFKEARSYFNEGIRVANSIRNKTSLQRNYLGLSSLDSAVGDFDNALKNYQLYILYRDSLNGEASQKKTKQVEMEYEVAKKEDQIKLLSTEGDLKTALIAKNNQQKNQALISLAALIAIGGAGFYFYRKKKRLQSKQSLLNERLRISRELHDEVGATLSGVAMYSHLTREQLKTQRMEDVTKSLGVIQQSSAEMVNKLNDIVWLVTPEQDSLEKLVKKLEVYASDMAMTKDMQVKVSYPEKIASMELPIESRRNIYLFCKEAINNAVKYSYGNLLQLLITDENGELNFSVSDNGKGFDEVMVRRGNGLNNMQQRADDLKAKLIIRSKKDEGSLVAMQIKLA